MEVNSNASTSTRSYYNGSSGSSNNNASSPSEDEDGPKDAQNKRGGGDEPARLKKRVKLDSDFIFTSTPIKKEAEVIDIEPEEQNWRDGKDLWERLAYMHSRGRQHDLELSVGLGSRAVTMSCHKLILVAVSPVFERMLNGFGGSRDSSHDEEEPEEAKGWVKIKNVTHLSLTQDNPDTFRALLKFIYTEEIEFGLGEIHARIDLLFLAGKYEIRELEELIVDNLLTNWSKVGNVGNVTYVCEAARQLEKDVLYFLAFDYILRNLSNVLKETDFLLNASRLTLNKILGIQELDIDEIELFLAIIRWAKRVCGSLGLASNRANLREILGDTLNLVRFPTMTRADFIGKVIPSGILTEKESQMILLRLSNYSPVGLSLSDNSSSDSNQLDETPTFKFNSTPRGKKKRSTDSEISFESVSSDSFKSEDSIEDDYKKVGEKNSFEAPKKDEDEKDDSWESFEKSIKSHLQQISSQPHQPTVKKDWEFQNDNSGPKRSPKVHLKVISKSSLYKYPYQIKEYLNLMGVDGISVSPIRSHVWTWPTTFRVSFFKGERAFSEYYEPGFWPEQISVSRNWK